MPCNVLLISIKPEYANKIFDEQTKQVELRRVRTRVKAGDIVVVYAKKFENPSELQYLQQKLSYLRPPQSYRYLNESEYETIMLLGGENPASLVDPQYKVLQ